MCNRILVWQKINLPKSDAQQPTVGSNATGNLRLSQANFRVNNVKIDKTVYFRYSIFNNLNWMNSLDGEYAYATFDLYILGVYRGRFNLQITHELHRIADQDNVPTILHWGDAIDEIRRIDVTGRTLSLYYVEGNPYIISID